VAQSAHVRDVARRFHREDEVVGRLVVPAPEAVRLLQAVEGAVDLDRAQLARRPREFVLLRESFRIEDASPRRVRPPRDADADVAVARRGTRHCSATPWLRYPVTGRCSERVPDAPARKAAAAT